MSSPKRFLLLSHLVELFQTITPQNGYFSDLSGDVDGGDRVVLCRTTIGAESPVPLVAINEAVTPDDSPVKAGITDSGGDAIELVELKLVVQGWTYAEGDTSLEKIKNLYCLHADLRKALARVNDEKDEYFRLGGLCVEVKADAGAVRPAAAASSELAFCWVRVTIQYPEYPADPYRLD